MLPAGTAAAFEGIVLDSANLGGNAFAFTAGSGATATIGASALTIASASSATTWTMGWPITLAGGAQTWNVGANNTLKLNAPWGGAQALTFAGSGTVELNATSTHSGNLLLDSGTFKVTADNALGASSHTVNYYPDRATLTFDGDIVNDAPINCKFFTSDNNGGIVLTAGSSVTFSGLVSMYSQNKINVGAGSTATFKGGLSISQNAMTGHLTLTGSGTVVVTNTPTSLGHKLQTASGSAVTLDLCVAGNKISQRYWAEYLTGRILTHAPNAFVADTCLYLGAAATLDLCGKDQQLNRLHGPAGASVKSDAPATLKLIGGSTAVDAGDLHGSDATRVNNAAFSGLVSVTKQGSVQHTLAAASSSTGTLKVTDGTLTLSGSWVNCTNLVVAGGTFAVKNVNAFGDNLRAPGESPKVEVDVASGASLVLDYTGHIDCAAFSRCTLAPKSSWQRVRCSMHCAVTPLLPQPHHHCRQEATA